MSEIKKKKDFSRELFTIIIPVYNEEENINKIVESVNKVKLPIKKEIIIIDDCSNDRSREKIKKIVKKLGKKARAFFHKHNLGKGAAIKTGIANARGTIIGIQDADLEYNPEEYKKLIIPILNKETNIVYGSRFMKKYSKKKTSFYYANRLLSLLTSLLYFKKITDMETCYKLFRKDILKNVKLKSNRFDFEPEFTAKMLKRGYKIVEIPIGYNPRTKTQGKKIGFKDGLSAIYSLIKYRITE